MTPNDYPPLRTRDADISVFQFEELCDIPPVKQLEWVQEHIDADAVGVDGVTLDARQHEPPECYVTYQVVTP